MRGRRGEGSNPSKAHRERARRERLNDGCAVCPSAQLQLLYSPGGRDVRAAGAMPCLGVVLPDSMVSRFQC